MRDISIVEVGIYIFVMTVLGRFILAIPTLPPAQMDGKTLGLRSLLCSAEEYDVTINRLHTAKTRQTPYYIRCPIDCPLWCSPRVLEKINTQIPC